MTRFLAPARGDVDGLRTGLERAVPSGDACQAWDLLVRRGQIPATWLAATRRFVRDPGDHYRRDAPTRDPISAEVAAYPGSLAECALYASDVVGVELAEASAATLVERLAPWGTQAFSHVRWWTLSRRHYAYASQDTRPGVTYGLLFAFNALQRAAVLRDVGLPERLFGDAEPWAREWNRLAAAGATVPDPTNTRPPDERTQPVVGRRFADLANPFEPLAAIERAGYATMEWVGAVGAARGAVVLVAATD
jgi:hypothetical protein